jgi:hypothetical protein
MINVSTFDNPDTDDEFKEDLRDGCPARLVKAYIYGHWVPLGGTVFPEFNPDVHVIPWALDRKLKTGVLIDWSPRTPHALWVQLTPPGNGFPAGAVVIDEIIPDGTDVAVTTERLCELIKAKNYRLDFACVDPAGLGTEATSGINQISVARDKLNTQIVYTTNARLRLIQNGIEHVKRMLEPLQGPPLLFFSDSLSDNPSPRSVLNAIRGYSYPKAKDGKPLDSQPEKDGITDHACDLLRYLAVNFFPVMRLQTKVRSIA